MGWRSSSEGEGGESCPFCGAAVPRRQRACLSCQAEKRSRKGMSPADFRVFFGVWAALAGAAMLLAIWMAIVPWAPRGEPPHYALWLVGVRAPVAPAAGCRVEVVDAAGRRQEVVLAGGCDSVTAATALRRPDEKLSPAKAGPDLTTRRLAATLHSVFSLATGLLVCWVLQRLLRTVFLRRAPVSWVRRAA